MTTKTEAIRRAMDECHMYRQSNGWIVSSWSPRHRATYLSNEMQYAQARTSVLETRLAIALEAMGYDNEDTIYLSSKFSGPDFSGSLSERLGLALNA